MSRIGRKPLPTLVLLVLAVAASVEVLGETHDRFQPIREQILVELDKNQIPSIAVAVARDDEILWEEAFGWADREEKIPATVHTMYSLASVTKPLTATAFMILVERGRIDLDRPMNDYLGKAKLRVRIGDPDEATVRRIANHTSGLPWHHHFFPADEPYPRPPMEVTLRRYGNVVSEPGEAYRYSNLGYGILEHAIERVSGKTFASFMREEVFRPLGMEHTSIPLAPDAEGRHAVRYDAWGEPLPFYDFDHRGASAAFSCVHDLARFGMFQLRERPEGQKRILSDRSLREMQKPTTRTTEGAQYGLGWEIREHWLAGRILTHRGGMPGVSTSLVLVPSRKITVAVLATQRTDLPMRLTEEILSALVSRTAWASKGLRPRTIRVSERSRPAGAFDPPRKLQGTWEGQLHIDDRTVPLLLSVEEEGGARVRLGQQEETHLWRPLFQKDVLSAWMQGDLGSEDANRQPHFLILSLKLRGNEMNGAVTAFSQPPQRFPYALSHWVELRKQP